MDGLTLKPHMSLASCVLVPGSLNEFAAERIMETKFWSEMLDKFNMRRRNVYCCICDPSGYKDREVLQKCLKRMVQKHLNSHKLEIIFEVVNFEWDNIADHLTRCDIFYMGGGPAPCIPGFLERHAALMRRLAERVHLGETMYVAGCGGAIAAGSKYESSPNVDMLELVPGNIGRIFEHAREVPPSDEDEPGRISMSKQTGMMWNGMCGLAFLPTKSGKKDKAAHALLRVMQKQLDGLKPRKYADVEMQRQLDPPPPPFPPPRKYADAAATESVDAALRPNSNEALRPSKALRLEQPVRSSNVYQCRQPLFEHSSGTFQYHIFYPPNLEEATTIGLYLPSTLCEDPSTQVRFTGREIVLFPIISNYGKDKWKNPLPEWIVPWLQAMRPHLEGLLEKRLKFTAYGWSRGASWLCDLLGRDELRFDRAVLVAPYMQPRWDWEKRAKIVFKMCWYGTNIRIFVGALDPWRLCDKLQMVFNQHEFNQVLPSVGHEGSHDICIKHWWAMPRLIYDSRK